MLPAAPADQLQVLVEVEEAGELLLGGLGLYRAVVVGLRGDTDTLLAPPSTTTS